MPSPFPGMDPYLETPELWPDVHNKLISEIQTALTPQLRPKYVARMESRIYISDGEDPGRSALVPDLRVETVRNGSHRSKVKVGAAIQITEPVVVTMPGEEIEEAYLSIRHRETGAVVAVIEVLSPSNKVRGSNGRKSFLDKRQEVLASEAHWVEIDLLRGGERTPSLLPPVTSDYRVLVSRGDRRRRANCWPIDVRQGLPVIGIPLKGKDPDVPLDLAAVFKTAYDNAGYDLSVDYRKPPTSPLPGADAKWSSQLLRRQGLR